MCIVKDLSILLIDLVFQWYSWQCFEYWCVVSDHFSTLLLPAYVCVCRSEQKGIPLRHKLRDADEEIFQYSAHRVFKAGVTGYERRSASCLCLTV